MARKTLSPGRLGTKRQCLACGAKYYDLGRKPPTCSRCGAKAEPERKTAAKPQARPEAPPAAAAPATTAKPVGREWSREQAEAIDRVGRWLKAGRAAGVPAVRLRRRRQDDARPPCRRGRARRDRLRRLHRQGGDGDARQRLRRRDDHPRADLPGERGRRGRADLHPQRGRPRLPRRPDRDRRMLDGRRGAGARPSFVRQADPRARRPVPAAAGQGRRLFHRKRRPT